MIKIPFVSALAFPAGCSPESERERQNTKIFQNQPVCNAILNYATSRLNFVATIKSKPRNCDGCKLCSGLQV